MKISEHDITNINSPYVNKDVWVCDLRFVTSIERPARLIKPIKVCVINANNKLIKKTIYYSDNALVPYNKSGELVFNFAFNIYDNTGYGSYKGIPINIFDNKEECLSKYKELVSIAISDISNRKSMIIESIDNQIYKLQKELN